MMILKFLKQSMPKPFFLLSLLVIAAFTFTCKDFIPKLNENPAAEFCWGRVANTLQVKFFAKEHPFDPSGLDYACSQDQLLSFDPDGEVVYYRWNFGDGTTGEGENPFHYFEEEGRYFVELTVIDNDDFDDTVIKEVEVYAENAPPEAILTTNSSTNTENINFIWQFDGSGSQDPDGRITNYKFEIRERKRNKLIAEYDGTQNNIVHIFNLGDLDGEISAKFKVQLTVKDDRGETDFTFVIITVNS